MKKGIRQRKKIWKILVSVIIAITMMPLTVFADTFSNYLPPGVAPNGAWGIYETQLERVNAKVIKTYDFADIGTHSIYVSNGSAWVGNRIEGAMNVQPDKSRMAYAKLFEVNGGQNISFVFTDESRVYAFCSEFDSNFILRKDGDWLNTGQSLTLRSDTRYVLVVFRKANGDQSLGSGLDIPVSSSIITSIPYHFIVFQPFSYTFNANGGWLNDTATKSRLGVGELNVAAPSRTGYTFAGWQPSGSTNKYITFPISYRADLFKDTTLYAQWTANTYTVNYNANGGSGSMSSGTATYDSNYTVKANSFSRPGYTFTGWKDQDGNSWTAGSTAKWTKTKNITLYAQWSPNTYKISYDNNGGTGSMSDVSVVYNTSYTIAQNGFSRIGYSFSKWNENANGTGTVWNPGTTGTYTRASNLPLYAIWTPNQYTVTYLPNTGTGATVNETATYDANYTVKSNLFTKTGYSFAGWKDQDENSWTAGSTAKWTRLSNLTLNAQWSPNNYTVKYYANTGTGYMLDGTATYDADYTVKINEYTKSGYTFTGWNESPDGTGQSWVEDTTAKWLREEDVNLYAQWMPNSYNISYNSNTGVGSMDPESVVFDTDYTTRENEFTKTGYTFTGWNESPDGTGQSWVENTTAKWSRAEDVTLYAQWTPNQYTIKYEANTGIGTMTDDTVTFDTDYTTRENEFTKTGYTFTGWNESPDGTGQIWTVGNIANWDRAEDVTLYAQWEANQYTIKYEANTGLGTMTDDIQTFDTDYTVRENEFVKTGYTFTGWNESPDGTGQIWTVGNIANWDRAEDVTLYAQWEANDYKVTYKSNLGKGSMTDDTVTFDTDYRVRTNEFERTGYTFTGWNEKPDGTGQSWIPGNEGNWDRAEDVTLYAQWSANNYYLTLIAKTPDERNNNIIIEGKVRGLVQTVLTMEYDSDKNTDFINSLAEYKGRVFVGYFTEDNTMVIDNKGKIVNDLDVFKDEKWITTKNITLYAHWQQKKPEIEIESDVDVLVRDNLKAAMYEGSILNKKQLLNYLINNSKLTALDFSDNNITKSLEVVNYNNFNADIPGEYVITVRATDGWKNEIESDITIDVKPVYPELTVTTFNKEEKIDVVNEAPTFKIIEGGWYRYYNDKTTKEVKEIPIYNTADVVDGKFLLGKGDEDVNGFNVFAKEVGYYKTDNKFEPLKDELYWDDVITDKVKVTKIEYFNEAGTLLKTITEPTTFDTMTVGTHKVYMEVTNKYENTSVGYVNVTVEKNEAPIINTDNIECVVEEKVTKKDVWNHFNIVDDQTVDVSKIEVLLDNVNLPEEIDTSECTSKIITIKYRDIYGKETEKMFTITINKKPTESTVRYISKKYLYTLDETSVWNTITLYKELLEKSLDVTHENINTKNSYGTYTFSSKDIKDIKANALESTGGIKYNNQKFLADYDILYKK